MKSNFSGMSMRCVCVSMGFVHVGILARLVSKGVSLLVHLFKYPLSPGSCLRTNHLNISMFYQRPILLLELTWLKQPAPFSAWLLVSKIAFRRSTGRNVFFTTSRISRQVAPPMENLQHIIARRNKSLL